MQHTFYAYRLEFICFFAVVAGSHKQQQASMSRAFERTVAEAAANASSGAARQQLSFIGTDLEEIGIFDSKVSVLRLRLYVL